MITATDTAGNAATQDVAILLRAAPTVGITDDVPGTANIDSGGVTFTFKFSEAVTGFVETDITVTGGEKGTFNGTDGDTIYTLVVTPAAPNTNDGTISVMVAAGVAFSQNNNIGNVAAESVTQDYDTLAPRVPDFTNVVTDEILNVADQNATLMGTTEAETTITLCFGGTDDACGGSSTFRTTGVAVGDVTVDGTTWMYTLVPDDITAMGQDDETLRVTATDAAGNSTQGTLDITVDTEAPDAPTFAEFISGQNDTLITAADRTAGVTINGEVAAGETGASVSLCFGGTDDACTEGMTQDADVPASGTGTAWSYTLKDADYTEIGQGAVTVRATATDAAGNSGATGSKEFMVDTILPVFSSGNSGVIAIGAPTTTVAYDAEATNNNLATEAADDGISYTLGGADALTFMIDPDDGEVRYKTIQDGEVEHNIDIIATDEAGNSATQPVTISVRGIPTVKITDNVDSTFATGADITFTFTFSEDVDDFTIDDIRVMGGSGSLGVLGTTTPERVYTLVVSPAMFNADNTGINDGTVTVTVIANAVTRVGTTIANIETSVSQRYDAVLPVFAVGPTDMVELVLGDPIANAVYDAAATDGSGMADVGISYTLGGTHALTFEIDADDGEVRYKTIQADEVAHSIEITATDKGGNTAVVTVTVTTVFSDDANLANLRVTPSLTPEGDITTLIPITPPAFDAATTIYTANVGSGVTEVIVIAPPVRSIYGRVAITGTAADDNTPLTVTGSPNTGTTVSGLTKGDNTITIEVTAPDGFPTPLDATDGTKKTYTLTINVASAPAFTGTIGAQTYTVGQLISLPLPTADGGLLPLTYTLTPDAPAGLTFSDDGTNRLLVGTPTSPPTATSLIYTATDNAGVAVALTFMVTVNAAPTFDTNAIPLLAPAYTYTANRPFTTLTLPPAGGGTAPLSYTLVGFIPDGLSFVATATARTLAGTPTVATTGTDLIYTVTDANGVAITAMFRLSGQFMPATVTSVSATDGTYSHAKGDSVLITIAFIEAVTVNTTGGIPQLTLTTGNSEGDGTATYLSGSGSVELTFTYTVRAGDNTGDLAYTGTDALSSQNIGIIQTATLPASLILPAVSSDRSLSASSNVVLDTTPPVFTETSAADNRIRVPVAINTIATDVFYNANANDRTADTDITYTVAAGTNALTFAIDSMSGELSPTVTLDTVTTFSLEITATDEVNNDATQYLSVVVVGAPVVTITDNILTDTANIADGDILFTFAFSEEVSGFVKDDIGVTNGEKGTFTGVDGDTTYTLVVTPTMGVNGGTITVTVEANVAIGETTNAGNVAANSVDQDYDTLAPPAPIINDVTADNTINVTESADGITLAGGVEDGAGVAVCINDGTGTFADCTGGTTPTANVETTTWSAPLDSAAISALGGDGTYYLRAQATDAAGNPGPEAETPFLVDTTPPAIPTIGDVTADNIISGAEQTITLTGTTDANTTIALCFGGTDTACTGGTSRTAAEGVTDPVGAGTTWSYPLNGAADIAMGAIGQGEKVTLRVTARDAAGNPAHGSRVIGVDTTPPVFTSTAANTVPVNLPFRATVYDANANDNGRNTDVGITYAIVPGTDSGEFSIVPETGIVTYNAVQNAEVAHTFTITATDEVGNAATLDDVTITVSTAPGLTITDSFAGDYIGNNNITLTLTYTFSEVVTGFEAGDITATSNGTLDALVAITTGLVYTQEVTITDLTNNDGTFTVTVAAGAAMNAGGTGTIGATWDQMYDTVMPELVDGDTATATAVVNDPIATVVYDANATDGGGADDEGITYTLGGTHALTFAIDADSGEVTYKVVQSSPTTDPHHAIIITATDKGGNTDTIDVIVTAVFSSDSDLSALVVAISDDDIVPLSPRFAASTYAYTANVIQKVTSVTITTTSSRSDASVTFAGTGTVTVTAADSTTTTTTTTLTIDDATATGAGTTVSGLTDGVNTITITVTAANGTTTDYIIALTRAPLLTFGDSVTIGDPPLTYSLPLDFNQVIVLTPPIKFLTTLTLPEASGGIAPLIYTLTPAADILAAGLTFTSATRIFSGTPTALVTRTLTYRVTDSALPSVSTSLPFIVEVVLVKQVPFVEGEGETEIPLDLDGDGDDTIDDPDNAILTLPMNHRVSTVTLSEPPKTATENPPDGIMFSLTSDITLNATLTADATVCLPTTDVPDDREAVLYHYPAVIETWNDIGRDTNTRAGFVCGQTDNFSPFAVGFEQTGITTRLNKQILTRASQAMTASTLEAVARRVEAVAGGTASSAGGTGTTPALAYQFGGQSSLNGLLKSHGKAMLEDNMEYERLFDDASFVVPLSAAEGGTGGGKSGAGTLSIWGGSDLRNLDSDNDELDWDGEVVSIHFGVDGMVSEKALAGLALSVGQSSFNYDDMGTKGEYNYSNASLNPYFGWFPNEDLKLWASAGLGQGSIEIKAEAADHSTDTAQLSLAGGFSSQLLRSTKHSSGSTTTLNVKGDVSMTSVDVDEKADSFDAQKVSSSRLRVLLSGEQQRGLASGGKLTPSLEMGVRVDGGDGVTGAGVELGGGLRYANPGGNFTIAGNVRTLLGHDYNELGADFLLQLSPSAGRGLSLSLHPVWGQTQSATDQLWDADINEIGSGDAALQSSLSTEVGYGVAASILGAPGVLTPYTGMTATDGDTSRLRLGSRFAGGNGLSLNLEGARKNTADGASHIVLLRGEVSF